VWVTDSRTASAADLEKFPGEQNKGSVVVKFSPDVKVLMTRGKPCVRGNPPAALTDPTDVVTGPANGDVYVAESHTDVRDPNLVARISVFDKNGTGPGKFRTPHDIEFDLQGRLIVAGRHNHRVVVLTKKGRFITDYPEFGRASGLAIDRNDVIYTAGSESTAKVRPADCAARASAASRTARSRCSFRRTRCRIHPTARWVKALPSMMRAMSIRLKRSCAALQNT